MFLKNNKRNICILSIIAIFVLLCIALMAFTSSVVKATKAYNEAVREYNSISNEYEELLKHTCIDNIDGMAKTYGSLKEESENVFDCFLILFGGNNASKIRVDAEIIISFSKIIEESRKIAEQITEPDASWVKKRLRTISGIKGAQLVTEYNDPNGLLGKNGGYVGCVYFTHEKIATNYTDVVSAGTDNGGCVEIYKTAEDALLRCEYLSQFDGTILYSGSYAIVGTMVVRTSYKFTNEEQFDLTDLITKALTRIE